MIISSSECSISPMRADCSGSARQIHLLYLSESHLFSPKWLNSCLFFFTNICQEHMCSKVGSALVLFKSLVVWPSLEMSLMCSTWLSQTPWSRFKIIFFPPCYKKCLVRNASVTQLLEMGTWLHLKLGKKKGGHGWCWPQQPSAMPSGDRNSGY